MKTYFTTKDRSQPNMYRIVNDDDTLTWVYVPACEVLKTRAGFLEESVAKKLGLIE